MSSPALWPAVEDRSLDSAPHPLASAFDPPSPTGYILIRIGDGPIRRWIPPGDPGDAPLHEPAVTDQHG